MSTGFYELTIIPPVNTKDKSNKKYNGENEPSLGEID